MHILESLAVINLFYQIGSLSQWYLKRKTWTLHRCLTLELYTILVVVGSSTFLLYGLFTNDDYIKNSDNEIGQMVDFIQMVGIRIAHIVSISESLFRRKVQRKFYENVREIDRIFECSLNVDINNGKFRSLSRNRAVLMFCVYMVSELFILTTKLVAVEQHFSLYWIFYLLPLLVCGLRYFQIFTLILIIKVRFEKLIQILNEINLTKSSKTNVHQIEAANNSECNGIIGRGSTIKVNSPDVPKFETAVPFNRRSDQENVELRRLLVVRELYNRIWLLTTIVNRGYGVSLLFNVGNDFISITSNCYWIFLNFKEYSHSARDGLLIAGSAVWTVPHLFNVLMLAIICERTVQTKTGIALSLHSVQIDILNSNHNSVIEQFSLQLLHQKMAFTASGFFNIDCSLLYTIVGATTTYLIILIQFHMNENSTGNANKT